MRYTGLIIINDSSNITKKMQKIYRKITIKPIISLKYAFQATKYQVQLTFWEQKPKLATFDERGEEGGNLLRVVNKE